MSIKMILVPADQYYQQTQPAKSPPTTLPPDVELKLRRHHETPYSRKDQIVPAAEVLKRPPGSLNAPEIGEKLDRLLQHLQRNSDRVQADKRTGEMIFDGKLVPGSDVRRLFGDVVSEKNKSIKPAGWEQLRDVLEVTHAPPEVLGQEWSALKERAALREADEERERREENRVLTREGAKKRKAAVKKEAKRAAKERAKNAFKPSDWQNL